MKSTKKMKDMALYEIIPSQDCMYLMHRFSLHKQMAQIPTSFTIESDADLEIMQKAMDLVIERNDCLRLAFVKQKGKLMQYFRPAYKYEVPVKYFRNEEEKEAFCSEDAKKPVRFEKGEIFRVYFFKVSDGRTGIYANFTHMVIDALGIAFFYKELLEIYFALRNDKPLPAPADSYEEYIINEHANTRDEEKMKKHEEFYKDYFLKNGEPFYAAVHGMDFLNAYRKKKKNPDIRVPLAYNPLYSKCDFLQMHIPPEKAEKIFEYCIKNQIAPESVFQMGLHTHCSAVNERIGDVSMMSVCSKRATLQEKNMCGCLAQPLQLRVLLKEDMSFDGAINELVDVRRSLYRHAAYPYTKSRTMSLDLFNYAPIQGPNSFMYSWIPLPVNEELGYSFEFRTYNLTRYFTPLYVITMPDPKDKGFNVCYMYRTKLSTKEQIERLHENMVDTIMAGIENPEITVGELLNNIEAKG